MTYLGLDPGKGGGIASVVDDGGVFCVHPMPATEREILDLLRGLANEDGGARAVLEHVWSIPGQGGAFGFGRGVGHLEMALTAAAIPFDQVTPKKWQKAMGIVYPKGSTDTVKKNITKRRAQQLFPSQTIGHNVADALLIASYCRLKHLGRLDV